MKRLALLLTVLAAAFAAASCAVLPREAGESADTTYTVYLVRHAEKQSGDDPSLTSDGLLRADTLADLLSDKDIENIWSSDYRRTRETAAPLAERLGIEVQLYDASDLQTLADEITADISERIWILLGQSVHTILERANEGRKDVLSELRMYSEVLGWTVSGQPDSLCGRKSVSYTHLTLPTILRV